MVTGGARRDLARGGQCGVMWRDSPVAVSLVYRLLVDVLKLPVLRRRGDAANEMRILVPCRQVAVLRRLRTSPSRSVQTDRGSVVAHPLLGIDGPPLLPASPFICTSSCRCGPLECPDEPT